MRFEIYGLTFETPKVVFALESPWRTSALEHRLFEVVKELTSAKVEASPDQLRITITDEAMAQQIVQRLEAVLKGWQEDADPGSERRGWFWMFEADIDSNGYDHTGNPAHIWGFVRAVLEQGGVGEPPKHEHIDLEGFGFEIHGKTEW